jgi:hypothetical protein
MKKYAVSESGMYGFVVNGVTVMGENLVISTDTGMYSMDKSLRINDFSRFTKFSDVIATELYTVNEKKLLAYRPSANWVNLYTLNFDNHTYEDGYGWAAYGFTGFRMLGDWFGITSRYSLTLMRWKDDGSFDNVNFSIPSSLYETAIYTAGNASGGDNDLWYLSDSGLGHLTYNKTYNNITDGNDFVIDRQPTYPFGTSIHGGPIRLTPSSNGLYITYTSHSRYPTINDYTNMMKINLLNNGFIDNITPQTGNFTTVNGSSNNKLYTGFHVVVDPEDASTIYVPSWFEGIWKFKDGKQIGKYDSTNAPFDTGWAEAVEDVAFDDNNNLWAISNDIFTKEKESILMLPAAKNKSGNVTVDDWNIINIPDYGSTSSRDSKLFFLKHSKNKNLAIFTQGHGDKNIVIYDTNGTSALSDDKYRMLNQFTDQDGKVFGPYAVVSVAEDQDGDVWLGTGCGVIVIHNLRTFLNEGENTIERVKVPRNDGSSLADYLLDNQEVTSVAVDAGNCKWFGTTTSGAYYVSSDGREIIENFTRENSMIPSNEVHAVVCDPNSNDVYFGTTNGLAVYHSTVAPSSSDFSNVYAYPNPVRPDYTGWITIQGLMDNSLVKIADSAGNVFYQTRSEGGMVIWDGCNSAGERVPTGVYFVYASQNQESSNGAVTKILVVR